MPGILLMAVTASVSGSENHEAIVALFIAGFVFTILAVVCLGHSSFELQLATGTVVLTKRWFLVSDSVCRGCVPCVDVDVFVCVWMWTSLCVWMV